MSPPRRYYACMYLCTWWWSSLRRRQRAALTHAGPRKADRQGRRKIGGAWLAAESHNAGLLCGEQDGNQGSWGLIATREGIVIDLLLPWSEPVRLGDVPDVTVRAHHYDPGSTSWREHRIREKKWQPQGPGKPGRPGLQCSYSVSA